MILDIKALNEKFENESATAIIAWVYDTFEHDTIKLSTSFGAEGMALIHLIKERVDQPRIFSIDTGRNFQETYDVWQEAVERYGIHIETFFPDPVDITELTKDGGGPNLFYKSVVNRKQCCYVRKVKPLKKALADAKIWISGLRRQQGNERQAIDIISWVGKYQVYKVCPIANWFETNVWELIRNNNVPYNKLHDKGFPTVGCAPCTRPVRPAEDLRSGRWWWEEDEKKECGIHVEDGKIKPKHPPQNYSI
jgi:phosphoadenosine phosphosulfate reductase